MSSPITNHTGHYILPPEQRVVVETILAHNAEFAAYLVLTDDGKRLQVKDYTFAGTAATFIIQSFFSLWGFEPVHMRYLFNLDAANRRLYLAMMSAALYNEVVRPAEAAL